MNAVSSENLAERAVDARGVRARRDVVGGFWWKLGLIVAAGVVARVLYTVLVAPWPPKGLTDEFYFQVVSGFVSEGHGFVLPIGLSGRTAATAAHPPLYPLVLAGLAKLGATDPDAQRLAGSVFGAGTIAGVGLLGRRLAGDRVALLAAGIAAIYPMLITADGALMSESLFGMLVAASLLAAYWLLDAPGAGRAVVLGAVVGLAALTRGEAVLLLPLVLVPVVRRPRGIRDAAICGLVLVAVLVPWTVRNWVVFDRFVPIATGSGSAIAGANCPLSYSGKGIGGWALSCVRAYPGNDAAVSAKWRRDGWRYAVDHVDRLPWVAVARERRVWGLLPLRQRLTGRSTTVEDFGVAMYFVLIVPAIYGFVVLRRRRAPVWILMTPFVLVFFTALFTYGTVRFREPAELSLVVLAAVGVAELWSGYHRRAADAPPDQTRPSPPEPARPPGEEKAPP